MDLASFSRARNSTHSLFILTPVRGFRCALAALAEHAEDGVGLLVALDGRFGGLELKNDIKRVDTNTKVGTF